MSTETKTYCDQCDRNMTGQPNEAIAISTKGRSSQDYTTVVTTDICTSCFTKALDAVNSVLTSKKAWRDGKKVPIAI